MRSLCFLELLCYHCIDENDAAHVDINVADDENDAADVDINDADDEDDAQVCLQHQSLQPLPAKRSGCSSSLPFASNQSKHLCFLFHKMKVVSSM